MTLQQIAWRCYELGYYNIFEYIEFCRKNRLNIF